MNPTRTFLMALAPLALLACGGGDDAESGASSDVVTAEADTGASAAVGGADVEFAQGMIAHHEQAIEMAEIALDPSVGARPEVVDLATRIRAAQDPEIDQMTAWLDGWGESVAMDTSDGHDMSSMAGMMSVEQMDALAQATGADFDRMWLEMMIEHHEGAIVMAEEAAASGTDAGVLALAAEIVATQQAEIDEMRALLG
jgi:uncharacterized protein (DUF305 family)